MKTLAVLLVLVAIATSQPHHWLSAAVAVITRCISR